MIYIKRITDDYKNKQVNDYATKFNLPKNAIKLLLSRGIDTEEKIAKFLNPTSADLYNPFLLADMQEGVKKINYHLALNNTILILGDYDVDGISASAIMYKYLSQKSLNIKVFIPNRVADGYGLTIDTIDKVVAMYHPQLIVTVDCGVSCYNEVEYIKKLGIDIIVTDHHEIPEKLPNCLVINAKRKDQQYPFDGLCGAGVALKVVHAMGGLKCALEYATIATLATIADIVPLIDENRAIVTLGLKFQKEQMPKGIKHMLKESGIKLPLNSSDVSFKIAPRINAAGRMGDPMIAFNLYIEENTNQIATLTKELLTLNDLRINATNSIFAEIQDMISCMDCANNSVIVLYNEKWECGVLGILASKVVEEYNRPACIITNIDGVLKGSLRSVDGVDIYQALANCSKYLLGYGGHKQAGGISLTKENLPDFIKAINEYISKTYTTEFNPVKYYDFDMTKDKIDIDFIQKLDTLEPFGFGNERPIFKLSSNNLKCTTLQKFPQHVKFNSNGLEFIAFNSSNSLLQLNSSCNKDILFEVNKDKFKPIGVSAMVRSINFKPMYAPIKSDYIIGNKLTALTTIHTEKQGEVLYCDCHSLISKINEINNSKNSFIVLCYDFNKYLELTNLDNVNFYLYRHNNNKHDNAIVYAPDYIDNIIGYDYVFILDVPFVDTMPYMLSHGNKAIFVQSGLTHNSNVLSCDRNTFVTYFKAIRDTITKKDYTQNYTIIYEDIIKHKEYKNLKFPQFMFVLLVMNELKIIECDGVLKYNKSIKSDLTQSSIYNYVLGL